MSRVLIEVREGVIRARGARGAEFYSRPPIVWPRWRSFFHICWYVEDYRSHTFVYSECRCHRRRAESIGDHEIPDWDWLERRR